MNESVERLLRAVLKVWKLLILKDFILWYIYIIFILSLHFIPCESIDAFILSVRPSVLIDGAKRKRYIIIGNTGNIISRLTEKIFSLMLWLDLGGYLDKDENLTNRLDSALHSKDISIKIAFYRELLSLVKLWDGCITRTVEVAGFRPRGNTTMAGAAILNQALNYNNGKFNFVEIDIKAAFESTSFKDVIESIENVQLRRQFHTYIHREYERRVHFNKFDEVAI